MTEIVEIDKIDQTDEMLASLAKRSGRAVKVLLAGLIVLVLGLSITVGYLVKESYSETARINTAVQAAIVLQQQRIDTLCGFYSLIGQLPVPSTTSKAGAELVIDSRDAYTGLKCMPALTSPSPELLNISKKYDIKITG